MDDMRIPRQEPDVGVVSLDDRRRIRSLEAQVDDLSRKLATALERVKPELTRAAHTECYHSGGFEVADQNQEVKCKACGALMDPYVVLRKIAHREVNFCYTLNALREEKTLLEKQVKTLRGTRSRLRAQVSKATPDTPADDVAAAMKKLNADSVLIVNVANEWGVWFQSMRATVLKTPAMRTLREALSRAVTDANASDLDDGAAE